MNLYIFKTMAGADLDFFDWLRVNVGTRYRVVRLLLPSRPPRRSHRKQRTFHSQVICRRKYTRDGGWSMCLYSAVCFRCTRQFSSRVADEELPKLLKQRHFRSRYLKSKAPNTLYYQRRFPKPVVISVLFDSAADMILCKMFWHDERK